MSIDKVIGVNLYPIKSAHAATVGGEMPTSLEVGQTGFEAYGVRDRDYVLYDKAANLFVSQRGWGADQRRAIHKNDKSLAVVCVDIQPDHMVVSSHIGQLEINTTPHDGSQRVIDIFGKPLPVIEQDSNASDYFSRLLGREVLLMRSDHDHIRTLPNEAYRRDGAFNSKAAADGFPFLMTSQASLSAAEARNGIEPGAVSLGAFRGNIAIDGSELGAFKEDYIDGRERFTIGAIGFYAIKPCMRCPIPNIDQETGENAVVGGLKALRGRVGHIPGSSDNGVFFGQNLIHADTGIISVGDPVTIEAFQSSPNIEFRGE